MSNKPLVLAAVLACGWFLSGCGEPEPAASAPPPSPSPGGGVSLKSEAPALNPSPTPAAPAAEAPPPSPAEVAANPAAAIGPLALANFQDESGKVQVTSGVDLLQRAVLAYMEMQHTQRGEDTPAWPPMTDLNLLVKYRILRALPAAPAGQKFVLDPKTRKVSLAPK